MEENTINKRVQRIIDQYYKGNVLSFSKDIGLAYTTVVDIIGEKQTSPTNKTLQKILNAKAIKLNPEWLLNGEGEILKTAREEKINEAGNCKNCERLQWKIEDLENTIRLLKEENKMLIEENAVFKFLLENGKSKTG